MKFRTFNPFSIMSYSQWLALFVAFMVSMGWQQAHAQDKFTVSGGGGVKEGSVYSAVIADLAGSCSTDQMTIEEVTSNGGVTNLQRLLSNKVNAAVIPTGLLYNAKTENASSVANIRTLVAFHPEALYLVVRSDTKKEGGVTIMGKNIGGDSVTFNNPEDLKGRPVGAVGGSLVDGRTFSDMMRYGWVMTEYQKTTELLAALMGKKIDAVLIQSATQASPAIEALNGASFKLIPLRGNSDTQAIWNAVKVQYTNMNGGRSVDTVSAQALLVTRKWSSPEMNAKLLALRDCYRANLGKLKDTTGTHPVWQLVELEDQGKWPMYEFPKAAPVATAPAAPTKKK